MYVGFAVVVADVDALGMEATDVVDVETIEIAVVAAVVEAFDVGLESSEIDLLVVDADAVVVEVVFSVVPFDGLVVDLAPVAKSGDLMMVLAVDAVAVGAEDVVDVVEHGATVALIDAVVLALDAVVVVVLAVAAVLLFAKGVVDGVLDAVTILLDVVVVLVVVAAVIAKLTVVAVCIDLVPFDAVVQLSVG